MIQMVNCSVARFDPGTFRFGLLMRNHYWHRSTTTGNAQAVQIIIIIIIIILRLAVVKNQGQKLKFKINYYRENVSYRQRGSVKNSKKLKLNHWLSNFEYNKGGKWRLQCRETWGDRSTPVTPRLETPGRTGLIAVWAKQSVLAASDKSRWRWTCVGKIWAFWECFFSVALQ